MAIDKSHIKAWQLQQEEQAKMETISSSNSKTIAEATEKLVIFKHRVRESKFTMATMLMISKTTQMAMLKIIMDRKTTVEVEAIAVNAGAKDRTSRTTTTRKMVAEVEAEVVATKESPKSMTRRRNSAGPRKNTSLAMKVKNLLVEVVAEVVAEAIVPKSASTTVMMLITKEKTEVNKTPKSSTTMKEETTEVTSVNTTKVATTLTMKQTLPLPVKITSADVEVVAEVAEEVGVVVKIMTIRTSLPSLMSTVARARVAEAVVEAIVAVALMAKASREVAAAAVAKIAATTTRTVASSKPEVVVEAEAVGAVTMTSPT